MRFGKVGAALAALVLSVGLALPGAAMADGPSVVAYATSGVYSGSVTESGYISWRNITYATAERWQQAVPVPASYNEYDCTGSVTTIPYQNQRGAASAPMSEDILTLDVYASVGTQVQKAPVLVCVNYGGGTSSNSNGADFSELLAEYPDLVIVNVNMRVAYFGCINLAQFPDYDKYGDIYAKSNNLSRTDFVDALTWIHDNIAAFGGDPDNITLQGASGGAVMAGTPLIIEDGCKYVNHIIMSSGTPLDAISVGTLEEAENQTNEFIEATGVKTIEEALALTPDQINDAQKALSAKCIGAYYPGSQSKTFANIADGIVIKENYLDTMKAQAEEYDIDIMSITGDGEYDRDLSKATLKLADDATDEEYAEAALAAIVTANWGKLDPEQGGSEKAADLIAGYASRGENISRDTVMSYKDLKNDINQKCSAVMICELWESLGQNAYLATYNYDAKPENRGGHAAAVRPVIGKIASTSAQAGPAWRAAVVSFCKTGDPNAENPYFKEADVNWVPFKASDHQQLVIDDEWGMAPITDTRWADINSLLPLFREYADIAKAEGTAPATIARISGDTAAETAAKIAAEGFETADTIILCREDDFADALGATGLAGVLHAPIILTDRENLSPAAAEEITALGAKKAYIIGGSGAMKSQLVMDLDELGVSAERVFGENSYDTSAACAKKIVELGGNGDAAIIAMSTNFQDALSMSSYAYKTGTPVILQTWGDTSADRGFTDEAKEFLDGKDLIVAGGPGAISDESLEGLEVAKRVFGETGYDTSCAIANWLIGSGDLSANTVTIACGAQGARGVDALAGAALAGLNGGPILLANANEEMEAADSATIDSFLTDYASIVSQAYVLGGTYVMPQDFCDSVDQVFADAFVA